jgi:multiple sugar transport system substrate-binding protein
MPGFLGPDGKPLPNIVKGAQFFTDLYSKYKVLPPDVLSAEWYEARTAFASGRACMILDFSLNNRFFSQQPGLNYGVALLPEGPARPYAWISPYDTVFFKGAQHMDEAVEFAKFLGTGQGAKLNSSVAGFLPVDQELLTEIAEAGDPAYQVFADSFKTAVAQCFAPECGGTEETWTPIIQSMLLGETTPEDAMAQMAAVIQANIDKMYTE